MKKCTNKECPYRRPNKGCPAADGCAGYENVSTEEKILEAIINYIKAHGYPPTTREIGTAVGLSSTSSVNGHMKKLFAKGMLETDTEAAPRAIRVPGYKFVPEESASAAGS